MIFLKEFTYDADKSLTKRNLQEGARVQAFVDSECIRRMDPYTPFDIGILKSAPLRQTTIGSGKIIQQTPYAKRWYYERANFQGAPMRGNKWFERMKASQKGAILAGAAKIAGAKSGE